MPKSLHFLVMRLVVRCLKLSAADLMSRRLWSKLNWKIGLESYVLLFANFLVTPDTLDYLISPTGKIPKEQDQVNAVVSSLPHPRE